MLETPSSWPSGRRTGPRCVIFEAGMFFSLLPLRVHMGEESLIQAGKVEAMADVCIRCDLPLVEGLR